MRALLLPVLLTIGFFPIATFADSSNNNGWTTVPQACSNADAARERANAEADASDDATAFHDFQRAAEQYELCANRLDVRTAFVAHYIAEAQQAKALTRIAAYQESSTDLGDGRATAETAGLQLSTICVALQSASSSQVRAVNHDGGNLYLTIGVFYLDTVAKGSPLEPDLRACMAMINAAYKRP